MGSRQAPRMGFRKNPQIDYRKIRKLLNPEPAVHPVGPYIRNRQRNRAVGRRRTEATYDRMCPLRRYAQTREDVDGSTPQIDRGR